MINYTQHTLSNGLRVLICEDATSPVVAVNTLFNVGSRDENPNRTGFAHLFEHLMFGGTPDIPDYDYQATLLGAETNAFTTDDYTNYYISVPRQYLDIALWLESDRMRQLTFSPETLAVQQKVVSEEYNFRYVNRPYGDTWLLLCPLCYHVHPYRWCTIGSDIRHVQDATLDDVKNFFTRFYCPSNAILAIVGDVYEDEVLRLVERYYGDIPSGTPPCRSLPPEPLPSQPRSLTVHRNVPADALFIAYPMCGRASAAFAAADLVSDILSNGHSSRLFNRLVKDRPLFSELDAYVTGNFDPGLFVVSGHLRDGVSPLEAKAAVEDQLQLLVDNPIFDDELEKVKNKFENTFVYSQYKPLDCAMSLCYFLAIGHLDWVNREPDNYRCVTPDQICQAATEIFNPIHQSTLFYLKSNQ